MESNMLRKTSNKFKGKITWLFVLYAVVTLAIYILPYTKYVFPYIVAAMLMLISLPLMMLKKNSWFKYGTILVGVTVFLMFVYLINGVSYVDAINDAIRNVRYFLPVLWGCFAVEYCTPKQQKIALTCFVGITALVLYKTLSALEIEPMIVRILAQDQSHSEPAINAFRLDNVGGYAFAYMMGIVTICVADTIFVLKKKWHKAIAIASLIFCFYFIIKSMYTTLLLLSSIAVLSILLFRAKKTSTKIMFVILFLVLLFTIAPLFQLLSQLFAGTLLSTKFAQMYDAITGGGADSLGLRPQLLQQAITNWLQTPLLGGNYDTPSHSLIFEILQKNGIVGLSFWLYMFFVSCCIVIRKLKEHNIDVMLFKLCCAYLFVLSIFNDTRYTFEITLALFFIVPIYSDILKTNLHRAYDEV